MLRSDAATTVAALTFQTAGTIDIGTTFRVLGTNKWQNITSSTSYIENGYSTKTFVTTNPVNSSFNSYDFSASNAYQPTIAVNYNQKLINGAMTINSTAIANFFGVDSRTTDNSASIANNVYAIYADATLGTNTSANRWAGYFLGRGYFSGNVGIGNNSIGGINAASVRLDVRGTTWFSADAYGQLEIIPTTGDGGETVIRQYTTTPRSGGNLKIRVDAYVQGGNFIVATNGNNERMRVTSSGNLLIGTTTDAGEKVNINAGSVGSMRIENSGTNASILIRNSTYPFVRFDRSGTVGRTFGIFNSNGDIAIQESATWSGSNYHIFYGFGGYATSGSGTFGDNVAANASAVLEAKSTTKGFLPPRMTNAQMVAIATPAAGLVVYDTTNNKLNVYDGTNWVAVH
jgi:hypothetical protein